MHNLKYLNRGYFKQIIIFLVSNLKNYMNLFSLTLCRIVFHKNVVKIKTERHLTKIMVHAYNLSFNNHRKTK